MKVFPAAVLAAALAAIAACPAAAAGLARTTLGCRTPGDLARAQAPKGGTLDAASRALVASGACTLLAKGVVVDVDEEKAPLTCVRLAGDLSCLWVRGALIDQHPGEKGSGGGRHGGGRSHGS
jgi:hypothetical protein